MESIVKVKRVFRTESDVLGQAKRYTVNGTIDLNNVRDCEEYIYPEDVGKNISEKYTIVLVEYDITNEYKIIKYNFEDFNKLYLDYRKYLETLEGIIKKN